MATTCLMLTRLSGRTLAINGGRIEIIITNLRYETSQDKYRGSDEAASIYTPTLVYRGIV